tara:strand:+ start:7969 stop:8541 length:573 start_codon:yes stop_codon:yes gene_type:complete
MAEATGAGYAAAITGVANMMLGTAADAAYEAAYGQYYTAYTGMHNAANQKVAAEANIAAIRQEKIHTDVVISRNQDQAEARAKVAAAVSGTEGQSVNAAIYQTESNSSVARANNRKNMEQQIENQLAAVYQSQSTQLALDNPQINSINTGLNLASQFAPLVADKEYRAGFMDSVDSLFSSEAAGGDIEIN